MYPEADVEKTQEVEPKELRDFRRQLRNQQGMGTMGTDQCNQRPMTSAEILAQLFTYHPPTEDAIPKYAAINQAAKNFAEVILQNCPPGADRSDAIRKIREARMTANAAIALNGLTL